MNRDGQGVRTSQVAQMLTERVAVELCGELTPLQLVILADDTIKTFPLPARGSVSLGRIRDNDICVDHPSVSRRHAILHLDPPLRIEDLGGTNGTFVGDPSGERRLRRLSRETVELSVGDCVTIGKVMVLIHTALVVGRPAPPGVAPAAPGGAEAIVRDPAMRALYEQVSLAAQGPISVLLIGETGVGKEVVARTVHARSPRADKPFIALNCAALPETLLESELFGHEKGSFTGAAQARPGLFEAADGGTIFLDEIGELPMVIQVKLLRVLEDRTVLRVGSRTPRSINVRFVSATNRDLEAEIERGTFRHDLFFRLNGISFTIPPLRERVTEILPLARAFIANASRELGRPASRLSSEAVAMLESYTWPGNIRELRNAIERAVILCRGDSIEPKHLPPRIQIEVKSKSAPASTRDMDGDDSASSRRGPASSGAADRAGPASAGGADRLGSADASGSEPTDPGGAGPDPGELRRQGAQLRERERIIAALAECAGNQTQAAKLLGISRRTLVSRLGAYDLPRPRKKG
jgi:DNA-binding NtrC family response regulator